MATVKLVPIVQPDPPKEVHIVLSMEEAEALTSLFYSGWVFNNKAPEALGYEKITEAPLKDLYDQLLRNGVAIRKWIAVTNDINPKDSIPNLSCEWPWLMLREEYKRLVDSYKYK